MKVGDLILLNRGAVQALELASPYAMLLEKVSRPDVYEYDWLCLVGDRKVMVGRQVEQTAEVVNV